MVEKATLSPEDKKKITELLNLENAVDFMSSEESEEEEEETRTGPPKRHVKPLKWERSKLKTIKALLDAHYQARMSSRKKDSCNSFKSSWPKLVNEAAPKQLSLLGRTSCSAELI